MKAATARKTDLQTTLAELGIEIRELEEHLEVLRKFFFARRHQVYEFIEIQQDVLKLRARHTALKSGEIE